MIGCHVGKHMICTCHMLAALYSYTQKVQFSEVALPLAS